jgi:hypothetical protein
MRGAIPPLFQYGFMARCLVKHRGNFTFTLVNCVSEEQDMFRNSARAFLTSAP